MKLPDILEQFALPGLTPDQLKSLEQSMAVRLPCEYQEFMLASNGLSVAGGLLLYGSEDLIERNKTWEVQEYAPGYIAIGDDGGGDVFLMKLNSEEQAVYVVGSGVMQPDHAEKRLESFKMWLESGLPMS